jgi:SAM-dependent methyltransferase
VAPDLQLEYWNRIGPTKEFAHPVNVPRLRQWLASGSCILDYGCGYGRALGILQASGYSNLLGLDPAPAMVAAARERYPGISVDVLDDFRCIPMADASVDAVLLFAVLTCVPDNDAERAIVREITRVLRPSGLLYISDMWLQTDERNLDRYRRDEEKYSTYGIFDLADGVTVRHHDRLWIESLLSCYESMALDEIDAQTMNGHSASIFQWFGRRPAMNEVPRCG